MKRCVKHFLTSLLVTTLIGCGGPEQAGPEPQEARAEPSRPRNPKIPVEVSYPIIKDEEEYNAFTKKRMVEVQLNMKVSPAVLREIALEVKAAERHQYERTFMFVFLPEKVPGARREAWATCHFNPTLDVSILGLTKEAEELLRKQTLTHPGTRIGAWLIEAQFVSHVALIYENAGKVREATIAPGGDRFDADMTELPAQRGRRFMVVGSDEIQEVDPSGVLRMMNRKGEVFAAALPLK
jgi:hypothetical protein